MDLENKYGTLEIQKECVKLLAAFHNLCVANDIKYSVAYGTLLGAVRHRGFIPWDDDIDVIVDRTNYEKILTSIKECKDLVLDRISDSALWTDKVRLSSSDYTGSYTPTIDIFLMDHSPDSIIKSKIKLYVIYMLQGMIKPRLSMKKGNWIMKLFSLVTYLLGRPFSHKKKYMWYQRVSQWHNDRPTRFEQCYNTLFTYIHCRFKSNLLDDVELVPFEDIEVYAMKDFDSFLRAQYGDYMTPPEEKKPAHVKISTRKQ